MSPLPTVIPSPPGPSRGTPPPRGGGVWLVPLAVLLIGLAGCLALVWSALRERRAYDAAAFERMAVAAEDDVTHRFMTYLDTLRAGAAFIRASESVDRNEWREFAATLDTDERYPGIRGVGVIYPVAAADVDSFVAEIRAQKPTGFALRTPGGTDVAANDHAILTFLEPAQRNAASLGLDMYSEPRRKEAALESRDSGEPRLTRRIELVQDGLHRPGALLFVPVYRREVVPATVQGRRSDHVAWICAPFVFEELFETVISRRKGMLELELFEGTAADSANALYQSRSKRDRTPFERVHVIEFAGRTLTFAWSRGERFAGTPLGPVVWAGGIGALGSLVLAGLVWSVQGTGRRARALADELTRDIAAAKRDLEVSQGLLQTVTEIIPGMVAYWTPDLRCAFSNSEYLEWFGRTPEQMRGLRLPDLLGKSLFRANEPYVRAVLAGERQQFERQLTKTNGDVRQTWAQYIPHRSADGGVDGFVVLISDVTDLKRQQDALRQSEARLRASLKEVTDLKTALDAHAIVAVTDAKGVITYANDRFCEVSDYTREEIVGQTHRVVNSGRHPPEFFKELWQTISAGRIWRGEICNRKRGGQVYWVETTIVPFLGEDGRPVQYIAIRTEITRRVELEQNLAVARDQALEASRLKSEFLATMSHEIRTPMNAIIGMAGLLSDTPLKPEQAEMLRIVTGAAESLLTIINDILDFSRIEAGQLRLDRAEFDLERVISETVSLLSPRAHAKHIRLDCAFNPAPTSLLLGDAGRVRQVLLNLIGNAVKFTEAGGVSVVAAVVGEKQDTVRVRVAVRDTGIGIPDDARDRLFHPFVQVDGSATRRFGGTGLGLAITRQLVNAMGGEIGFESRVGRGSTFTFELELRRGGPLESGPRPCPGIDCSGPTIDPPEAEGASVAETPSADVPRGQRLRLLVVEDNVANQQVAIRLLQTLGHAVEVVDNGHAALERLAVDKFHAVLMDCHMPSLDGYETTRWIRSGKLPGVDREIPVIALTAYARDEDRRRCLDAGMDGYVSKPIRTSELQAALSVAGESRRNGRESRRPAGTRLLADSVLDPEVLETTRRLPGMHGPSLLPELVKLYHSQERHRLETVRRLVSERSVGAADEVHGFGGDAASFGGMEVRGLALELEVDVRAGDWGRADARLADLEHACERLRDAIVALEGIS